MHIPPPSPRFQVESLNGGLRIVIPSRRSWFNLLFSSGWLVGWVLGEAYAIRGLLNPTGEASPVFLASWLVSWTLGGVFAMGIMLWQLGGRELIFVDATTFEHRVEAFGMGRSRRYAIAELSNLRVLSLPQAGPANQAAWMPPVTGSGHGPIAFDYGARTQQIAASLDEAEARMLLGHLVSSLPRRSIGR